MFKTVLITTLASLTLLSQNTLAAKAPFALVIHGGAGTISKSKISPEQEQQYRATLSQALAAGYKVLEKGGSSLDAVESAIVVMENSPLFNAGKGAVYTHNERHELDASIMRGDTLNAGAVGGIRTVKNPIRAARTVMEKSKHVMLVGSGAEIFAKEQGLELVENSYFSTDFRLKQLQNARKKEKVQLDHSALPTSPFTYATAPLNEDTKFGTVGAVALDKQGNLAAGTSTGGMTNKRYGRVGDSPVIGAGTYADNQSCAISATGHGEYFIRAAVAHDIHARMRYGSQSLEQAADAVIMKKLVKMGGKGGIIGLDHAGQMSMTFNTSGMYRAYAHSEKGKAVFIYKNEE